MSHLKNIEVKDFNIEDVKVTNEIVGYVKYLQDADIRHFYAKQMNAFMHSLISD